MVKQKGMDRVFFILVTLGALCIIYPLIWAFIGSFKTTAEVFSTGMPEKWHFENYKTAIQSGRWIRYFLNSGIMAFGIALCQTLFGAMAGYSLARFSFPGKRFLFGIVIVTLTLSQQVVFVPMFQLVSALNWIDTFRGLIIPLMISPFGIFLTRQYMMGITDSIFDAARIDGASEPRIFFQIVIPVSKPVLVVVFILAFTVFYNDLLWPLIVVRSDHMFTVSLALQQFKNAFYYRPELVLAITMLVILPITIIFLFLQKFFLQGVSIGGDKG